MGRVAQGWKLKPTESGIYAVRFRHEGKRYDRSTGERDPRKARNKAIQIYTNITSGAEEPTARVAGQDLRLDELMGMWLEAIEPEIEPETHLHYSQKALNIIRIHFKSLGAFTKEGIAGFMRLRLRDVQRVSVVADIKVIRRFLSWVVEASLLAKMPEIPPLARSMGGKAKNPGRKTKAVHISEAEALSILANLPERAPRAGWTIRDRFIVQWETSLRQATIGKLRVPEHFTKGAKRLVITDAIDKARFGRALPLTDRAREALERCLPEEAGPIFGRHLASETSRYLKLAAGAALPPERAKHFSAYDFRHGRIAGLLAGGAPLSAVAYLAGHTQLTTTNRYVQVAEAAHEAEMALQASGGIMGGVETKTSKKTGKKRA